MGLARGGQGAPGFNLNPLKTSVLSALGDANAEVRLNSTEVI